MLDDLLQMLLKLLLKKQEIQNKAEAAGDLTGNKISDKIRKVSRISPQKTSGIVKSKTENIGHDKEIPKERYISPEKAEQLLMI